MAQAQIDLVTLREFCQRNGIPRLLLFGSIARGDATSNSDIDLIADLPSDLSLLDMVRLERELSSLLGRKVDLLTQEAISPYIRERIQDDLQVLYEAGYTVYLRHILDSITKIEGYLEAFDEQRFLRDSRTHDAVIRQIEIIGEATKHLSQDIRSLSPAPPGRTLQGCGIS